VTWNRNSLKKPLAYSNKNSWFLKLFLCNYFMVAFVIFLYLHLPDMLFYFMHFHIYFQYNVVSTFSVNNKDRDWPSGHWGEVEVHLYPYAISALEMGWVVNTTYWALYPPGKRLGTHCTGKWQWNLGDKIL